MTTIAPIGSITRAEDHLRAMLADCPAFQSWVGADDADAAGRRIHVDALWPPAEQADGYTVDELTALRPFALVYTAPENGFRRSAVAGSASPTFTDEGIVLIELEEDFPTDDRARLHDMARRMKNLVGGLLDELGERAGRAGYLDVNVFELDGPAASDPDDRERLGVFQMARLTLHWGLRGVS